MRALAFGALAGFAALALNCSFIYTDNADQCAADADCAAKGPAFANTICIPATHTCQLPLAADKKCIGTIRTKLIFDLTATTKAFCHAYTNGLVDYLREINDSTDKLRGCNVDYQIIDDAYDPKKDATIWDDLKSKDDWPQVVQIFGWGTPSTLALSPLASRDHKNLLTGSWVASVAAPVPVNVSVDVPQVADAPNLTTVNKLPQTFKSDGFPYNFNLGTDYSTAIRTAMYHVKSKSGKRVGFFHCTASSFCTLPLPAGRTFAQANDVPLGRDLVLEFTDTQDTYDTKIEQYFKDELDYKKAHPEYDIVDWIWSGNTVATTAFIAKSLKKVQANHPDLPKLNMIVNTYGHDESLFAPCGDKDNPKNNNACVGSVFGIQPFIAYNDATRGASEMPKVVANMAKWRERDKTEGNPVKKATNPPPPDPYYNIATIKYVQGYAAGMLFKAAVSKLVDNSLTVTAENLKAAYEQLQNVDFGGLTDKVSYSTTDHRPQSTVALYTFDGDGNLVNVPPDRTITLQASWLGW
jgi:branched-chain amino acid transport system substrate-binding protein